MAETGRCWYCGSEDVEEYSDGSCECMECGMTWGYEQKVQNYSYQRHSNSNYASKQRTYFSNKRQNVNSFKQVRTTQTGNDNTYGIIIAIVIWGLVIFGLIFTCS